MFSLMVLGFLAHALNQEHPDGFVYLHMLGGVIYDLAFWYVVVNVHKMRSS